MLGKSDLITFLATRDADRAKDFFSNVLGLHLVADESFALVFDANGIMLRISKVPDFTPFPFTVLGWRVPDIADKMRELNQKGVIFQHFDGFGQDEQGIWSSPDDTKIAWFKDPDGNTLSLTQFGDGSSKM